MKLSTFCVLLASALMLMGALIGGLMKTDEAIRAENTIPANGEVSEQTDSLLAVSGRVARQFGAEYSDALGQWAQNDRMTVEITGDGQVAASADLSVMSIEPVEGGSCVLLNADGVKISIWPVIAIRVFEGSILRNGEVIGTASGNLFVRTEIDGVASDPSGLVRLEG